MADDFQMELKYSSLKENGTLMKIMDKGTVSKDIFPDTTRSSYIFRIKNKRRAHIQNKQQIKK